MPVYKHNGYGINWDTGPFDQEMAIRFEKALRARQVEGEVTREFWGRIVEAAAETGVIPPLEKPVARMSPGVVAWLAGKIALYHKTATDILPE